MPQPNGHLPSAVRDPCRLLVRGVNWLGDAVMTTPALQRLREAHPQAHIALLTPAKLAELWLQQPYVDAVLPFENGENVWRVACRLRREKFDTALLLPNSIRSALEAWLAGIPRRIGVARPGRKLLLTRKVAPYRGEVQMRKLATAEIQRLIESSAASRPAIPPAAHQLHHYLHLAAALGANREPLAPRLVVAESEVAAMRQRCAAPALGEGHPPLFGLNAGAEYGPAKRWPPQRFIAAAVLLQRRTRCHWWIFGASTECALAETIAQGIGAAGAGPAHSVRCLAGQTTLRELCAALRACDVVLTNDTGPMHLAAAVGTPVVVPFGSTSPELTGPGLPGDPRHQLLKAAVPCSPCFLRDCPVDFRCLNGITVESVTEAVLRAWQIQNGFARQ